MEGITGMGKLDTKGNLTVELARFGVNCCVDGGSRRWISSIVTKEAGGVTGILL